MNLQYICEGTQEARFSYRNIILKYTQGSTLSKRFPRIQWDQDFMLNSSFIVNAIWENAQKRGHVKVGIVIRLFHRNINFRYTQGCTLGKKHTYAAIGIGSTLGRNILSVAIVTKLSKGKGIFLYTWGLTTSEKPYSCSH